MAWEYGIFDEMKLGMGANIDVDILFEDHYISGDIIGEVSVQCDAGMQFPGIAIDGVATGAEVVASFEDASGIVYAGIIAIDVDGEYIDGTTAEERRVGYLFNSNNTCISDITGEGFNSCVAFLVTIFK